MIQIYRMLEKFLSEFRVVIVNFVLSYFGGGYNLDGTGMCEDLTVGHDEILNGFY